MLITEFIEKTKNFLQRSLLDLKSFFFRGNQKLPKPPPLNPFSCSFGKTRNHQKQQCYTNFCNPWESDPEEAKMKTNNNSVITSRKEVSEENACSESFMKLADQSPGKKKQEERKKGEKNMESFQMDEREDHYSQNIKPEGYTLAQKMKQLDMMDAGDVEHVLDVEEAIHYYSRLKSPVYLDIVDKFFTDMYSELSVSQHSASINSSK